jgi:hypothetical protein
MSATVKQEVIDLIARLPEETSIEDIQYHLYVLQKIKNGITDVREGRVLYHTDAKRKFEKWLGK